MVRNYYKPVNSKELEFIFENKESIVDFITHYSYFHCDSNREFYIQYIKNLNFTMKNDILDSGILLAELVNFYDESLLSLISDILLRKRNFFLKLTCLDYLLFNVEHVDHDDYKKLNEIFIKNRNPFLNLQSNLNLLAIESSIFSQRNIKKILLNAIYPSIFYRFFNIILDNLPVFHLKITTSFLNEIEQILKSKNFDKNDKDFEKYMKKILKRLK